MATSFTVNFADLTKILTQIRVAENHAAGANLIDIIGPDAALLPVGLRTVDGTFNNLLPGQSKFGSADQILPRLLPADFRNFEPTANPADGASFQPGPGAPLLTNNNYALAGSVVDTAPRTISNIIVAQDLNNPAAVAAWFANPLSVGAWQDAHPGMTPVVQAPGQILTATEVALTNTDIANIPNQSPDIGLSPGFNGWMTLFGQFFDHGLDLVNKGGAGTVFIPLLPDDPLFVVGGPNFMALTRATPVIGAGPDGVLGTADDTRDTINQTTPWIDQNQTYTSSASHQVFLREYVKDGLGHAVSTGRLLNGANGGIANWAEVKAQAITMLGIRLGDFDVLNVPTLMTDPYGKFIPDPATGFAQVQVITSTGVSFVSGVAGGLTLPPNTVPTGHPFLADIAHHAAPGTFRDAAGVLQRQVADADPGVGDDGLANTYDDEMLNAHFITGDGRGNENIGLTAVHTVFHSEHNRLV